MRRRFDYEIRRNPKTGEREQWLIEVVDKDRLEHGPFKSFEGCRKTMNRIKRMHPEPQQPGA
jgi:hypothetical protein